MRPMDWQTFDEEVKILAGKVTAKPDVIVGIVRGGIVPARLLAKHLGVKEMYAISVKKAGPNRVLTSEIKESLAGKSALLVEDVLETAGSILIAKEYLENRGAIVRTAALYVQKQTMLMPDHYLGMVVDIPTFPWD